MLYNKPRNNATIILLNWQTTIHCIPVFETRKCSLLSSLHLCMHVPFLKEYVGSGPSAAFFGSKGVRNGEMADFLWYSYSCQTSYSRVVHLRIEGIAICLFPPSQFFCVLGGWCCEYQQALIDRSLSVCLIFSKFYTFFLLSLLFAL